VHKIQEQVERLASVRPAHGIIIAAQGALGGAGGQRYRGGIHKTISIFFIRGSYDE
jgi:hypothetical protein